MKPHPWWSGKPKKKSQEVKPLKAGKHNGVHVIKVKDKH